MSINIKTLAVGAELPPLTRDISQYQINRYADASGDHNPIHIDPAFAAGTAAGGTIAHGMLVLAIVSEFMTQHFGPYWLTGGHLSCRFKDPARPGDTLTISGEVTKIAEDGTISAEVVCTNQQGDTIQLVDTTVKVTPDENSH